MVYVTFFFNDTATTEIYTLSLHDALPIWYGRRRPDRHGALGRPAARAPRPRRPGEEGQRRGRLRPGYAGRAGHAAHPRGRRPARRAGERPTDGPLPLTACRLAAGPRRRGRPAPLPAGAP